MRIRTILAFTTGAAVGAAVTWVSDPDHGSDRRVEARRWAMAQGREQAEHAARAAATAARSYGRAAVEGFVEAARDGGGSTRAS